MTTDQNAWTDEQLLLTAEEAARALNVGRTTLYALIKDGQLRSVHHLPPHQSRAAALREPARPADRASSARTSAYCACGLRAAERVVRP